jgi:preprotein translocase subunit SecG
LVLHVTIAISMIALILLQHGKGADAGAAFGSGASATVFGARGSASFLSRATAVLAFLFFSNSLVLAYMAGHAVESKSVVTQSPVGEVAPAPLEAPEPAPKAEPPKAPDLPVVSEPGQGLPGSEGMEKKEGDNVAKTPAPETPKTPDVPVVKGAAGSPTNADVKAKEEPKAEKTTTAPSEKAEMPSPAGKVEEAKKMPPENAKNKLGEQAAPAKKVEPKPVEKAGTQSTSEQKKAVGTGTTPVKKETPEPTSVIKPLDRATEKVGNASSKAAASTAKKAPATPKTDLP